MRKFRAALGSLRKVRCATLSGDTRAVPVATISRLPIARSRRGIHLDWAYASAPMISSDGCATENAAAERLNMGKSIRSLVKIRAPRSADRRRIWSSIPRDVSRRSSRVDYRVQHLSRDIESCDPFIGFISVFQLLICRFYLLILIEMRSRCKQNIRILSRTLANIFALVIIRRRAISVSTMEKGVNLSYISLVRACQKSGAKYSFSDERCLMFSILTAHLTPNNCCSFGAIFSVSISRYFCRKGANKIGYLVYLLLRFHAFAEPMYKPYQYIYNIILYT